MKRGVRSVQSWYELFGSETGVRAPIIFQHVSHFVWNDLKNNFIGKTDAFVSLGYSESLLNGEAEDREFWLRYFLAGWEIVVLPQVGWRYRRHPSALSFNWTTDKGKGTARANAPLLKKYFDTITNPQFFELLSEYIYLGERFSDPEAYEMNRLVDGRQYPDLQKIYVRLDKYRWGGKRPPVLDRAGLRVMKVGEQPPWPDGEAERFRF